MRLKFKNKTSAKVVSRLKKKVRIRKSLKGTLARPRLCIFRSNKHISVQLINDQQGHTLCAYSTLNMKGGKSNIDSASKLAKVFAEEIKEKSIQNIVFDRNGYLFHGCVKTLANSLRENGINF